MNHKHAGVKKSHDVKIMHKDEVAKQAHWIEINVSKPSEKQTAVPKVIYQPITHADQILVKFNRQQLNNVLAELDRSGAMEIGIAVVPYRK